jgi:site-specific recombinase XerD
LSQSTQDRLSGTVFAAYSNLFIQYLAKQGYASSTINVYSSSLAHFSYWTAKKRIKIKNFNEALVLSFLKHLPTCNCAKRYQRSKPNTRAALSHFLVFLRKKRIIAAKETDIPDSIAMELRNFGEYLTDVRGLCSATIQARLAHTSKFLLERFPNGYVEIYALKPNDIKRFIKVALAGWKPSSIKVFSNSLKSYLRYKAINGFQTSDLIASFPRISQWRLSSLPKELMPCEIRLFLDAFDQNTVTGRRDYAISRCYVDLGLRTSEIARLQLDDLIWREGVINILGKGRRIDILPLPAITGSAIAEYLKNGRPQSTSRALFLRHRPPLNLPANSETIRAVVRNAAQRCGLSKRLSGPHILRHTLANRLVKNGATLKQIADLLRHRSLDTSTIYAKVDLKALGKVALPWPGGKA